MFVLVPEVCVPLQSVWHSRDTCNVSATRIARCRERIARRLFVPMLPLLQAKSLTRTPGTPFFEFSFISVTQSSYQATLPVQPDEFFNFLQSEVETSFKLLCDKWRRVRWVVALLSGSQCYAHTCRAGTGNRSHRCGVHARSGDGLGAGTV